MKGVATRYYAGGCPRSMAIGMARWKG